MANFIIGILILLLFCAAFGLFSKKAKKTRDEEPPSEPEAAGMMFDRKYVGPSLYRIASVLDSGLDDAEIHSIETQIAEMTVSDKVKDLGTFPVVYDGKETEIRIEAKLLMEGEDKEVILQLFSDAELVQILDEELMAFADELGI